MHPCAGNKEMTNRLLGFLSRGEEVLTAQEIASRLDIPLPRLRRELDSLKKSGKIREKTLDQILSDDK
jgi:DNA-binding IclR family transcriptional regulator